MKDTQASKANTDAKETPLMRQYWDIKSAHLDKVLLFRMGDFFEMFFDDAIIAAPILGIALTSRNKKGGDETPMCGLPHHAVGTPINKLLAAGYKVAICDQIEDPKMAKGIVKRAVTRVLTPGMVYDSETLESTSSHYIAALDFEVNALNKKVNLYAIAFADVTTGDAFYFEKLTLPEIVRLLQFMPVFELILEKDEDFNFLKAQNFVWTKTLSFFSVNDAMESGQVKVCQQLKSYISSLGGAEASSILRSFEKRQMRLRMELSPETLRHLEVFENYRGTAQGSLFKAINRCETSPGARLLKQWLYFPLRNQEEIEKRFNRVSLWAQNPGELKNIRNVLSGLGDIERRLSRLSTPQANGRDLISVAQATIAAVKAYAIAQQKESALFSEIQGLNQQNVNAIYGLAQKTLSAIREDAPLSTRQGHLIQNGVSVELDEYINLSQNAQGLLAEMEAREKKETGISSLKIRYNNVFGYYIEITNTHKEKVPSTYQRKQTLANAERYCTDELIELEKKVLTAQSKRADLEFAIFEEIRKEWLKNSTEILRLAQTIAELDVLTAFSWLAIERKYVRPQINTEGRLKLKANRHPTVEQDVEKHFIANDVLLEKNAMMLITGPNMAGKSTLMRQVALTVLMAQIGCFVPATEANLFIFDRIFTRIGASDQLSEGLSTFMVEMQETATLLKEATSESLVIVDEVGRGTSTTDGLSLAQAILEHLVTHTGCISLFATHYHELTQLEGQLPHLHNYHLAVSEANGDVRFLHTLVKGPTLKSYGIYVAELAGIPQAVTKRARALLKQHHPDQTKVTNQLALDLTPEDSDFSFAERAQTSAEISLSEELLLELKNLSVTQMTPLDALNKLAHIQSKLQ